KGTVDHQFRQTLFPLQHHLIDKFGDQLVVVLGIRKDLSFAGMAFSRHLSSTFSLASGLRSPASRDRKPEAGKQEILFWSLRPVPRTASAPLLDADRIQGLADNLITNSLQIFHPASPNQYHRVFLQVVSFPRNVRGDLD